MKLLKKLLVSVDFSDDAQIVVNQAAALAKLFNSRIILIHVVPTAISKTCDLDHLLQPATQSLEKVSGGLQEQGVDVESSHVFCAEPFEELLYQAERFGVNLVVMGAKDYEPDGETGLGVTTRRVIRKSQKPVWVVHSQTPFPPAAILCAVDFSEASQRALKSAITLARTLNTKLHVLHSDNDKLRLPGHFEPLTTREKIALKRQAVEGEWERFLEAFDFHQVQWEKHLVSGDPRQAILHAVGLLKADLIMLGSIGQNRSSKLQLGSVAEAVIRSSGVSLMTFKNEHAIKLEVDKLLVSITDQFNQGKELLENGLADEAIAFFEQCLREDIMFLPAWEGLAEAYHRLGMKEKAQQALDNMESIKKRLWERKVEFELKQRFWKKN